MRSIVIISILCLHANFAAAQALPDERLRDRVSKRIDAEAKQAEDYKKYLIRDSIPYHKQLADSLKQVAKKVLKDSVNNYVPDVAIDSTLIDKYTEQAKSIIRDSLDNYVPGISLDSAATSQLKQQAKARSKAALEEAADTEIPELTIDSTTSDQLKNEAKVKAMSALEEASGMEITDISLDSTTVDKVKEESIKQAEELLKHTDEYKAMNNGNSERARLEAHKAKLEQTQEQIRRAAATKELKQKMTSQAKQFITENADKIQQVQAQMGKLKQKYSYVPNSNDLSTADKRSSLEGESLWKRLVIGGNFNISKTNPVTIDLSPAVGYKFNKLFEAGLTASFRTQFSADKSGVNQDKEAVYGYSIFANHMVFKNFFGYLEGENMYAGSHNAEIDGRRWVQTLLIGIGRKFNIAKWLEMQALVLFNMLHDNQDALYNSPVVFKTGVRLK